MARPIDRRQTESGKRTQAERNAETRRKIIDATVACIEVFGFPKTTMQRVARKAGVTVGAVQHHFASKSELLAAVLADGFETISFELDHVRFAGKLLPERVALFVDHCWLQTREPAFQASMHILLGLRSESPQSLDTFMLGPLLDITERGKSFWLNVFADMDLSEEQHRQLLYFVFSALSGIAAFARVLDPEHQPALIQSNLGALKDLLLAKFLRVQKDSRPALASS